MCQVGSALRGQREHMVHLNDIWFLRKLLGPAVSSDRPLLAALRREKSVVRVHEGNCFLRLLRLFVRKDSLPLSASLSLHLSTGQLPSQQQLSLTHCSTEWLSLPNPASPLGPGDPLFPLLFGPLLLKFKRTLKEMAFPLPTLFTLCSSAHVTYLFFCFIFLHLFQQPRQGLVNRSGPLVAFREVLKMGEYCTCWKSTRKVWWSHLSVTLVTTCLVR